MPKSTKRKSKRKICTGLYNIQENLRNVCQRLKNTIKTNDPTTRQGVKKMKLQRARIWDKSNQLS